MRRRFRRILLWIFLILILVTGSVFLFIHLSAPVPPVEKIDRCNQLLSKARNAEGREYARELLEQAESVMDDAMLEWKIQNTKWVIERDYTRLLVQLAEVEQKANEAYHQSIIKKDSLHHDLAVSLADVKADLKHYRDQYSVLPLNQQARRDFNTAEMLCLEAETAYEQGNYNRVGPRLERSRKLIQSSIAKNRISLESYFSNVPTWKRWADATIEWSKTNGKPAIIVDKFAGKCYLYRQGKQVLLLDAEFGINWIGDKKHKGDRATPEGRYYITRKKTNNKTKYYKALLINYPNDDDKARYAREVKNGTISRKTGIGGLIEIHGEGGKGINWTEGCVAISNDDMDKLFNQVEVGTPVTIIGSWKPLDHLNSAE